MTAAKIAERVNRAWPLWVEAKCLLETMDGIMLSIGIPAAEDAPTPAIPDDRVRDMHKAVAKFQEKFSLLVREQKRKAAR